jgi:hypothetical protein
MRKVLIGAITVVALLFAAATGYIAYLGHKLALVENAPGIRLEVGRFVPTSVAEFRTLDLGYEHVSVPQSLKGGLVRFTGSNFISLQDGNTSSLTFGPPIDSREKDRAVFLHQMESLTGASVSSWYELNKLELAQQPFTVWQIPRIGRRKAIAQMTLLTMKSVEYSRALLVREWEDDRVGLIVTDEHEFTVATIADRKTEISQEIFIDRSVKNPAEVLSAIVTSHDFHIGEADPKIVEHLISGADIKKVDLAGTECGLAEARRLDTAEAEVKARRLLKLQEH